MPKMKTNKAAAKRYKYTAKGKVKRTTANGRHRLATKTARQKMSRKVNTYADKTCEGGIKKLLPYGN
jgi:large subunit ribosomal protein L35